MYRCHVRMMTPLHALFATLILGALDLSARAQVDSCRSVYSALDPQLQYMLNFVPAAKEMLKDESTSLIVFVPKDNELLMQVLVQGDATGMDAAAADSYASLANMFTPDDLRLNILKYHASPRSDRTDQLIADETAVKYALDTLFDDYKLDLNILPESTGVTVNGVNITGMLQLEGGSPPLCGNSIIQFIDSVLIPPVASVVSVTYQLKYANGCAGLSKLDTYLPSDETANSVDKCFAACKATSDCSTFWFGKGQKAQVCQTMKGTCSREMPKWRLWDTYEMVSDAAPTDPLADLLDDGKVPVTDPASYPADVKLFQEALSNTSCDCTRSGYSGVTIDDDGTVNAFGNTTYVGCGTHDNDEMDGTGNLCYVTGGTSCESATPSALGRDDEVFTNAAYRQCVPDELLPKFWWVKKEKYWMKQFSTKNNMGFINIGCVFAMFGC